MPVLALLFVSVLDRRAKYQLVELGYCFHKGRTMAAFVLTLQVSK
jgi:hypothetical protein